MRDEQAPWICLHYTGNHYNALLAPANYHPEMFGPQPQPQAQPSLPVQTFLLPPAPYRPHAADPAAHTFRLAAPATFQQGHGFAQPQGNLLLPAYPVPRAPVPYVQGPPVPQLQRRPMPFAQAHHVGYGANAFIQPMGHRAPQAWPWPGPPPQRRQGLFARMWHSLGLAHPHPHPQHGMRWSPWFSGANPRQGPAPGP